MIQSRVGRGSIKGWQRAGRKPLKRARAVLADYHDAVTADGDCAQLGAMGTGAPGSVCVKLPAMILTQLPDLPPRPETAANAAFRRGFYQRWGRENAIVCGRAASAEYSAIPQCLSIKAAFGGAERYLLLDREVSVDDDSLLILNEGRTYGSRLAARRPAESFAVFFRPGLLAQVRAARGQVLAQQLDDPLLSAAPQDFVFSEHLRPHGPTVSPRLAALRAAVLAGERSEDWLEQQLLLLASAMLDLEADDDHALRRLPAARASTRQELARRLRRAADCIESDYQQPLTLDHLADVACLSRFHFLRHFSQLQGLTPYACLMRKRAQAARRLIAGGDTDREAVAQQCGFGTRWALQRALQRFPADHRGG